VSWLGTGRDQSAQRRRREAPARITNEIGAARPMIDGGSEGVLGLAST
jgi:hypothetical protein